MVDLVKSSSKFPEIAKCVERREGKYIAGIREAKWSTSMLSDEPRISGIVYIDTVEDTATFYKRKNIFDTVLLPVTLSSGRREFKKAICGLGSRWSFIKTEIEDWGEFLLLFGPLLDYYKQEFEAYAKSRESK